MEPLPYNLTPISIVYILLAILVYYISAVLYSYRWKLVLEALKKRVPFSSLVKAMIASIFINNITPMSRSGGEVLRILWLRKKHKISTAIATASVLYERLIEAFPHLIMILLGALYLANFHFSVTFLGVLLLIYLWWKWENIVEWVSKTGKFRLTKEEVKSVASLKRNFKLNLAVFLLSSLFRVLDVLRLKLVTLAVGINLGWWDIVVLSVANFLFGMVGFTPGAVGFVEGGLVGTFLLLGVPAQKAVAATLLERFISYVLSSVVGFLVLTHAGGSEVWRALRSRLRRTGSSPALEE